MNSTYGFRLGQLVGLPRICVRHNHNKKPKKPTLGFQGPEGHGERLWVWCHRRQEHVIYGFKPTLDNHHALKQLPFNGKKTKPAKLRKDYWSPLAVVEFPAGQGSVGRSVYQKLRELKHLHEVAWGDDVRYKTDKELTKEERKRAQKAAGEGREAPRVLRTVKERGWALNAQKKNAIADMAAVLSGLGAGNRMVLGAAHGAEVEEGASKDLVSVTVNWANDQDQNYAQAWSNNVTHGLLEDLSQISKHQAELSEDAQAVEDPQPA